MVRYHLFIVLFFLSVSIEAQQQLPPIGQWREHLPYNSAIDVTAGDNKVWCATPYSLFTINIADNPIAAGSAERLSRVTGLNETGISAIKYDDANNKLFIAYSNSNIDILYRNDIYNVPDIKQDNIAGDKRIYNIYSLGRNYYLSTGLGIIVIDGDKYEVKDSWFIGNGGNQIKVNGFTSDANFFYAATDEGLKRAAINTTNLADYVNWQTISGSNGLSTGGCKNVLNVQNKIVLEKNDSLFALNGNIWTLLYTDGWPIVGSNTSGNKLELCQRFSNGTSKVTIVNADGTIVRTLAQAGVISFPKKAILKYRVSLLLTITVITIIMGYWASKVRLSYEAPRAVPSDNPKYIAYQEFRKKFGEDGNLLVIGIQTNKFFEKKLFNDYAQLQRNLKNHAGVEDVIAVTSAVNLVKLPETEKLKADTIFPERTLSQTEIDSGAAIFLNLPFYRNLLYNPETNAWLLGVRINKDIMSSRSRIDIVRDIKQMVEAFGKNNNLAVYLSGLPLIRTELSIRISGEMRWFLMVSVILSAIILLLFFRSFSSMLLSLAVVIISVLFSFGTMWLLGYQINILTALIPPLIVVIGIPNCIYFLNKFHTEYNRTGNKKEALIAMVGRMGVVMLFCNLSAAIGFAVFSLTRSQVLKEFGQVEGINILALFFISLILIPAALSFLPPPKTRHTKYLQNPGLNKWLTRLESWSLNHRKLIYTITLAIVAVSVAGTFKLKTVGFIVDDLPKTDKLYTDLKFFEKNFKGIMPLEIVVDTKKKYGVSRNLSNLQKIDSLSQFLATMPVIAKPLSIIEGLKFAKQAFFDGDSNNYSMPAEYDLPALSQYLNFRGDTGTNAQHPVDKNSLAKLVTTFMDSAKQQARISVNMADIGSKRLPNVLDSINRRASQLFPKEKYDVQLTGSSVTFLEGSSYIIAGLKQSIFWAFVLIALCMLYLFRSFRILICSLIPNIIPLLITAGVMGWTGVALKPSTVLVFSVALGIAIDVTIRFLVNYKQELPKHAFDMKKTVIGTIYSTGISIIYTSLVLIAGFIIFCFSGFGGTQALGWLTSLTLITATFTNLVLLPAILISVIRVKK